MLEPTIDLFCWHMGLLDRALPARNEAFEYFPGGSKINAGRFPKLFNARAMIYSMELSIFYIYIEK